MGGVAKTRFSVYDGNYKVVAAGNQGGKLVFVPNHQVLFAVCEHDDKKK